ncbi:hypothetical protein GF345_02310 [Candidatus Woesearchaeota archaeon]|nr:hypothetical protein [Candidatus Woesearchaeota archaeon]
MKRKIDEVIELLDFNELMNVKKDIEKGGERISRIVDAKIKQELKRHSSHCCVCNAKINPFSVFNFTLVFGPEDMKKKASFCAIDCLEHFLSNLKDFCGDDNTTFIKRIRKTDRKHERD